LSFPQGIRFSTAATHRILLFVIPEGNSLLFAREQSKIQAVFN
jgi:hypothetical protein